MLLNPVQSRRLFSHALENHYGILAVNADSHSAVTDCLEAARSCSAPVIIEASLWQLEGHGFGNGDAVLGMARYIADLAVLSGSGRYRDVPAVFHTDHIKGPKTEKILGSGIRGIGVSIDGTAVKLHPSTISLDASSMTDDENIEVISQLARIAADAGVKITLEMESAVDKGITPAETTRLLVGTIQVSSNPDPPISMAAVERIWKAAEEYGRSVYDTLVQEYHARITQEREIANCTFAARRNTIERIGLPGVRNHRLDLLAEEERTFQELLDRKARTYPEMVPLLVIRVEGGRHG